MNTISIKILLLFAILLYPSPKVLAVVVHPKISSENSVNKIFEESKSFEISTKRDLDNKPKRLFKKITKRKPWSIMRWVGLILVLLLMAALIYIMIVFFKTLFR